MNHLVLMAALSVSAWTSSASASTCVPDRSDYHMRQGKVVFISSSGDAQGEQVVPTEVDPHSMKSVADSFRGTGPCSGMVNDYARDKSRVYYRGKPISKADTNTFEIIDRYFSKDGSAVYGLDKRITTRVADFRPIRDGYATDGQRYFYKDTILAGQGFEFVANTYEVVRTTTTIYYRGKALDVDVKSFEGLVPSVSMARDKNRAYCRLVAIPKADPETIEQIDGYLWKDKRAVYLEGREIVGLDPATARRLPLDGRYNTDSHSVFKLYEKIDRDPATFAVLQPWYTKDKNGVYYRDERMDLADPESFVTTSMGNAQDRNYRFDQNRISCKINPDAPATVKVCDDVAR